MLYHFIIHMMSVTSFFYVSFGIYRSIFKRIKNKILDESSKRSMSPGWCIVIVGCEMEGEIEIEQ